MRRAVPFAVVLLCGFIVFPEAVFAAEARLAEAEIALAEGLAALHEGRSQEAADWFAEAARLRLGRSGEPEAIDPAEADPAPRPIDDRGLWEADVGVSLATDSNPSLFSKELSLPTPGGTPGDLIRGDEGDDKTRAHLRLGVYPFHARERLNLGVTVDARRSFHQDFGFLDLGQVRGALQLAFGSDPLGYLKGFLGHTRVPFGTSRFSALLQAGGTTWQLDDASYLQTWEAAASLTFQEARYTASRLDFGYSDRDFSDAGLADERRSGEDLSLQASQLFYLGRRDRYVRIGVLALDRQADRAFSGSILEGNAELSLPIALRWTVHLEGSVREDDFDHPESNRFVIGGPVRNDTTTRAAVSLVWAATERLRAVARGTYVDRSSNVDLGDALPDLDYRRTIVSAGLSWVF